MTFTVIDAPAPAGLISICAAAVPLMALISTVPPDLAVFSACQPPDGSAFCSTGFGMAALRGGLARPTRSEGFGWPQRSASGSGPGAVSDTRLR
jgi:hypothetical protein